jgi:peptidoglycan/LPS O-acetylase OafA/YrhL
MSVSLKRRRRRDAQIPRATWGAVGVGALLAVLVSVTRSFTLPAAVLISIALLLIVGAVAMQLLGDAPALVARRRLVRSFCWCGPCSLSRSCM